MDPTVVVDGTVYPTVYSLWVSNPEYFAIAILSLAIIIGLLLAWREYHVAREFKAVAQYIPRLATKVAMRERAQFVRKLIAADIHAALEKRVWDQSLTRIEVNTAYRKMSIKSGNTAIMPGIFTLKKQLKAAAAKRKLHAAPTPPNNNKAGNVVRPAFGTKSLRRQAKG